MRPATTTAGGPVDVPSDAQRAALRLRSALEEVGFDIERDFAHCRADVTSSGEGFVAIGRLSLSTADRLAATLETAKASGTDAGTAAQEDLLPPSTSSAQPKTATQEELC